jgi:serine/threonine protein kinase
VERLIGEQLGNYQILDELGRGGMARVYRARQINLDRECALKLLRPELAEDESFIDRFMREARAVAKLDHPNIVPVYDTGRVGPYHFLAMKFLEGATLAQILHNDRLDLRRVAAYVGQAASALKYAHEQGVVHRDVKPGNMIIDDRGWLTITDFGLARLSQEIRTTMTGTLLGTPAYMAPEQVSGDTVTPQTDIYQLGVVTYEMLTGTTPFRDRPQHAMLLAHLHEEPTPVHELNPDLTPEINDVVQRALAKAPSDRYQAVSAFADDLIHAIFAIMPAAEQAGRIGPYDVSRLPETVSWTDANLTPYRIVTDRLSPEVLETSTTEAAAVLSVAAEPTSEQIHQSEATTAGARVREELAAAGVAGGPGQVPPGDGPSVATAGNSDNGWMRYIVAGGVIVALIAFIAMIPLTLFVFGIVGGGGGDEDPTATPTIQQAVAPGETPSSTEAETPTSTATVVVPAGVPASATSMPASENTPTQEPTVEPTATATLRPTLAPAPTRTPIIIFTPTPVPQLPAPADGQALLETDLSDWFVGALDNGGIYFADGTYHLFEESGSGGWVESSWSPEEPYTDFSVSVELHRIAGDDIADACVMARLDSVSRSYDYSLCIDGSGGVWAYYETFDSAGVSTKEALLGYGRFTAATPDNWARLKVIVQGENLWFYVNDTLAGTALHTGPAGGNIGVIVNNYGESAAEYEFTNLVVRALQ